MSSNSINPIDRIDMQEIWEKISELRRQFPTIQGSLPIDIFQFMEIDLKLNPIPFPDLLLKYRVEAALASDFQSIYLDAEQYTLMEKDPIWKQYRLRFTVAHEIAHYFLHKKAVVGQNISSPEGFVNWFKSDKFGIEQEANEFAGCLLVPNDKLGDFYDQFAEKIQAIVPDFRENEQLRIQFADRICSRFAVNSQVVAVRLDRDGIWPAN
jgi:hypothetical protein